MTLILPLQNNQTNKENELLQKPLENDIPVLVKIPLPHAPQEYSVARYVGYDTLSLSYTYLPLDVIGFIFDTMPPTSQDFCKFPAIVIPSLQIPYLKYNSRELKTLSPCTDSELYSYMARAYKNQVTTNLIIS